MSERIMFFGKMSALTGICCVLWTEGTVGEASGWAPGVVFAAGSLLCSMKIASLEDRSWPSLEGLTAFLTTLVNLENGDFLECTEGEDELLPVEWVGGGEGDASDFVMVNVPI